ncbi:hypothetical protein J6590_057656 [Homalodisca vitripennis]|nr:hypothetical protein J6590_057656 [Homalodisca vitripennis]
MLLSLSNFLTIGLPKESMFLHSQLNEPYLSFYQCGCSERDLRGRETIPGRLTSNALRAPSFDYVDLYLLHT